MTRIALALSPHLDDAAFSCGASLRALADAGWRVAAATIFTASTPDPQGFALACQLDKGLDASVDYMALRRAEDARALAILGAEPTWGPFCEAPHRGYQSKEALFGPLRAEPSLEAALDAHIGALIEAHRPALVLAPQAIGGHVDHVQLVRALDRVGIAAPMLWWRDFPYSARAGASPFAARFDAMPERARAMGEQERSARVAASLAYGSQARFQFGGADGLEKLLGVVGDVERLRGDARALALLP